MGRADLHAHLPADEAPFAGWLSRLAPLLSRCDWDDICVLGNESYINAMTQERILSIVEQRLPVVHLGIETYVRRLHACMCPYMHVSIWLPLRGSG